jgi:hypothetical protein
MIAVKFSANAITITKKRNKASIGYLIADKLNILKNLNKLTVKLNK